MYSKDIEKIARENNKTIFAADLKGKPLQKLNKQNGAVLVLGNEAQGVNAEKDIPLDLIKIPMNEKTDSLNVASAGSILLYNLKN